MVSLLEIEYPSPPPSKTRNQEGLGWYTKRQGLIMDVAQSLYLAEDIDGAEEWLGRVEKKYTGLSKTDQSLASNEHCFFTMGRNSVTRLDLLETALRKRNVTQFPSVAPWDDPCGKTEVDEYKQAISAQLEGLRILKFFNDPKSAIPTRLFPGEGPEYTSLPRLDVVEKKLQGILCNPGAKCLVFSQFTEVLKKLQSRFAQDSFVVNTNKAGLSDVLNSFQTEETSKKGSNNIRILFLDIVTGGEGLNLTAANNIVFVEPSISTATMKQAIGRAFRLGQRRDIEVHLFALNGTVESMVAERVWEGNRDAGICRAPEINLQDLRECLESQWSRIHKHLKEKSTNDASNAGESDDDDGSGSIAEDDSMIALP